MLCLPWLRSFFVLERLSFDLISLRVMTRDVIASGAKGAIRDVLQGPPGLRGRRKRAVSVFALLMTLGFQFLSPLLTSKEQVPNVRPAEDQSQPSSVAKKDTTKTSALFGLKTMFSSCPLDLT